MKKVTMQQIADRVGVSKFAVSQALAGKHGVSEETREKIVQTASMLGYYSQRRVRLKPRQLPLQAVEQKGSGTKNTVIVLIPNVRYQNQESLYWGRIIDGVTMSLEEQGIGVMMVTEHNTDNFLSIINPQGILGLVGIGLISSRVLLDVRQAEIPFVLVDHEEELVPSDTVFMNNYDCMRRATAHLAALGHTAIRFVGNPRYSRSFYDRWMGFRSVLEEQGIPVPQDSDKLLAIDIVNEYKSVTDTVRQIHASGKLPTAFACANDFLAFCVMNTLRELGVSIPEQISVTGFDNSEEGMQYVPSLSSVDVPKQAMGKRAVEMLLRRINHPNRPIEKTLLYGEFIVRNSIVVNSKPVGELL
ncbi:LacI family DNA-binding transcriptional regulator [Paenibacillus solisilvae]|uniref:LacI family DNA-binding transcriptional regulator n=1 Tax=Paenibacillus solisilvae TaxID=2486751 RepID=A0ABW0W4H1_9BACL